MLSLSLVPRPKAIDDRGGKAVVSVAVYDDLGQPRGGTVNLTATAGDLGGGGTVFDLNLDDAGTAHLDYTCVRALDAHCEGSVRLDARWRQGADFLETVLRIAVSTPDAGVRDGGP